METIIMGLYRKPGVILNRLPAWFPPFLSWHTTVTVKVDKFSYQIWGSGLRDV